MLSSIINSCMGSINASYIRLLFSVLSTLLCHLILFFQEDINLPLIFPVINNPQIKKINIHLPVGGKKWRRKYHWNLSGL